MLRVNGFCEERSPRRRRGYQVRRQVPTSSGAYLSWRCNCSGVSGDLYPREWPYLSEKRGMINATKTVEVEVSAERVEEPIGVSDGEIIFSQPNLYANHARLFEDGDP